MGHLASRLRIQAPKIRLIAENEKRGIYTRFERVFRIGAPVHKKGEMLSPYERVIHSVNFSVQEKSTSVSVTLLVRLGFMALFSRRARAQRIASPLWAAGGEQITGQSAHLS